MSRTSFQPVKLVAARLHGVELLRRKIVFILLIADRFGKVIRFTAQRFQALRERDEFIAEAAKRTQRILRLLDSGHRAKALVPTVQAGVRLGDGGNELFAVAQNIAAGKERLLLPLLQVRALELADLMVQHVDTARFFGLVHLERVDRAARLFHHVIARTVRCQLIFHAAKAVEVDKVLLFVE